MRERDGKLLILCGDLNVALEERDIHPKLRKPNQIGARPTSARCSRASSRTAWSTCIARSSTTTTTCSPGGRRGAR